MERKNAQESTQKSKVFQIPIEDFEEDMDTESVKEKKKFWNISQHIINFVQKKNS